jgi:predicted transcriptional regulator
MAERVRSFRLDARGLERVLGELEAAIMESLWERGRATIREVTEHLSMQRVLTFNTVMTVMNRLVDKGLLVRAKAGRQHVYRPALDRGAFLTEVAHAIARGLVGDMSEYAVPQFAAAVAESDPAKLDELEQLVADWKARKRVKR